MCCINRLKHPLCQHISTRIPTTTPTTTINTTVTILILPPSPYQDKSPPSLATNNLPAMSATVGLNILRDEFPLSTLLLTGAILQIVTTAVLPLRYAIAPALALLLYKTTIFCMALLSPGTYHQSPGMIEGRFSAMMPPSVVKPNGGEKTFSHHTNTEEADDTPHGHGQMTVFVLGFQSSHPLGKFGPGVQAIQDYAMAMYSDLEDAHHRTTNGFLGRTPPLLTTDSPGSNAIFVITYWRSLEDLHKFAISESHMKGWKWFDSVTKQYPHLGIAHEVYEIPAGGWENVYHNFRRFGIALNEYQVEGELGEQVQQKAELVRKGKRMAGMYARMGKAQAQAQAQA